MKRQSHSSTSALVEFWLVDGKKAEPGVSFAFDADASPLPRPSRKPSRLSVLSRRRRLSQTLKRMS
jgi:hypothetical protein